MAITPDPAFRFGPWMLQDAIVGPAVVPYLEDGDAADFTDASVTTGWLTDPVGHSVSVSCQVDPDDASALSFALPGDAFEVPGVWQLQGVLQVGGNTFRTAPALFVVEAVDGWLTVSDARRDWRDAPSSDVVLFRLVDTARIQVEVRAREVDISLNGRPASNLVGAQSAQMRNLWNAVKTDPSNQGIGDDGFVIRPYPMDATVKNMIRPQPVKPVIA